MYIEQKIKEIQEHGFSVNVESYIRFTGSKSYTYEISGKEYYDFGSESALDSALIYLDYDLKD